MNLTTNIYTHRFAGVPKKFLLIFAASIAFVSCGTTAKLVNSSTYVNSKAVQPIIAPVIVDLDIQDTKISYSYLPTTTVRVAGLENVIATAVKEALQANGNADVIMCLEKQVKFNKKGVIESVVISGFPAKYKNFRTSEDLLTPEYVDECIKEKNDATAARRERRRQRK